MNKYIPADKLIAEIERLKEETAKRISKAKYNSEKMVFSRGELSALYDVGAILDSLQQEQPSGKQVIIITETDGDANIHWDCRSLDDVMALLTSAKSFIADKQTEELRGQGSGPDYNTTEGRFRNAHKFQQEQPEVDLEKEIDDWYNTMGIPVTADALKETARHFYELGRINARKDDNR